MRHVRMMMILLVVSALFAACATTGTQTRSEPKAAETKQDFGQKGNEFLSWCRSYQNDANALVQKLKDEKAGRNVLETLSLFNQVEMKIDDAWAKAGLYQLAHPDEGIRKAGLVCEQEITQLHTALTLDHGLYLIFSGIDMSDSKLDMDDVRFVKKVLFDFRRNGVDKDEETRAKIKALRKRMTEVAQQFDVNLSKDVREIKVKDAARLAGLPQDFIDGHKPDENGVITLTTTWPDYVPVVKYAKDTALRKEMWETMMSLGVPENTKVFQELLEVRHELATVLGYDNYAAFNTEDKMIKNPQKAQDFIDRMAALALEAADRDKAILLARKQKDVPEATEIMPWEKHYYSRLVKQETYQYDPQKARQYFAIEKVQKGVLDISSKIYGISFKPNTELPLWHESVQAFDVLEGETVIGHIYLDLYPRENKYKHFAMFPIIPGVKGVRLPEGAIEGNFQNPAKGPAFISHGDVTTFFHEFGHLMHHILAGQQKYLRFSGTACEWDFVEVPSQLYEEWAWNTDILQTFATNDKGEPIPAELVAKMRAADEFGKGLTVRQQMYYAGLSLGLYTRDPKTFTFHAFEKEVAKKYSPWPYIDGTHMVEGFGHLVGYASNYYTYMWSLVIVKDFYAAINKDGLMNTETMSLYRKTILEPGGAKDAAITVGDFLGRDFTFDAFEAWLKSE